MKKLLIFLSPILLSACTTAASARSGQQAGAAMLPDRTLQCTLGRALNLDPTRNQTLDEIRYEGAHSFTLFLPAAPKHIGPPPDPSADPGPVDPAARIVADPSGLAPAAPRKFTRVADLWPARVEIATALEPPLTHIIIITEIDEAKGTANLFMTRAADAASLDLQNVYQGGCSFGMKLSALKMKPGNGKLTGSSPAPS